MDKGLIEFLNSININLNHIYLYPNIDIKK